MNRRTNSNPDATRIEKDSMGPVAVPAHALYGAQTQRACDNFAISGWTMPPEFLQALARIKSAAAAANSQLGLIPQTVADAISHAASGIVRGEHGEHFPLDVFQTGSGTSTNMNMNEVLSKLAQSHSTVPVHPNDHVNCSQSSNDVIPSAMHVAAAYGLHTDLIPAVQHLIQTIEKKSNTIGHLTKTGRTHLMDAMPIRLEQELAGWSTQLQCALAGLQAVQQQLCTLALGGTAVGTGINAHADFSKLACEKLTKEMGLTFQPAHSYCAYMGAQDTTVACGAALKILAVALMKIANDLRWMNSGPLAGLGEIQLPALQPGSSIMPGKVNPVIPEAVCMACAHTMGADTILTVAGQSGNFQLNVMLPLMAYHVLHAIRIMANSCRALADKAIDGFVVHTAHLEATLGKNPILVTALNHLIGYEKGAEIAKYAYQTGRPILDVATEMTDYSAEELATMLDPAQLTHGGLGNGGSAGG